MASFADALRHKIDRATVMTTEGVEVYDGKRKTTRLIVNRDTCTAIAERDGHRAVVTHDDYALAAMRAIAQLNGE